MEMLLQLVRPTETAQLTSERGGGGIHFTTLLVVQFSRQIEGVFLSIIRCDCKKTFSFL